MTLARQDWESRFGGELSWLFIDAPGDLTSLRFDLHGQYVTPSGFGGYGALPVSYLSTDADSETAVGNLEVGAIYTPQMSNPQFGIVLFGGLTLPTAGDGFDDIIVNAAAITSRITDLALIIPEGVTLRLGASPQLRAGQFFGRIDGGLDINLSASGDNADPLFRINLGGGFNLGSVAITGELANLISTEDNVMDNTASTVALQVRGFAGTVQPYGGVVIPLDDEFEEVDVVLTVGLDVGLR